MNASDLARLELAKRAFKATQPSEAEVQTGVRRARLALDRSKPRGRWFSKGLVFVVLAVGSLAYAKPQALGELVEKVLPHEPTGAGKGVVRGSAREPVEAALRLSNVQPSRAHAVAPATPVTRVAPNGVAVEANADAASVAAAKPNADAAAPVTAASKVDAVVTPVAVAPAAPIAGVPAAPIAVAVAASPSESRRTSGSNQAELPPLKRAAGLTGATRAPDTSSQDRVAGAASSRVSTDTADGPANTVSGWGRVGQAVARGDDAKALAALNGLSESGDRATRDKADLGRAQLLMAHGNVDKACSLARALTHRRAGGRIERQAQLLLKSCGR